MRTPPTPLALSRRIRARDVCLRLRFHCSGIRVSGINVQNFMRIKLMMNVVYNKLGFQWASSLLAFLTLAMMPFP
jgi:hypothetical protein